MINKLFSRSGVVVPAEDPDSFGNLAVEKGYITRDDLEQALTVQTERLGEVLLRMGKLTEEQLECLLLEQRTRKGEKISAEELRKHERKKLRRRIGAVTNVFEDMGNEARGLASSVTESMNGRLSDVKMKG